MPDRKRLLVYVLMHEAYGVVAADYCPARLDRFARAASDSGQLKIYRLSGLASSVDRSDPLELCPVCNPDCRDGLVKGVRND